MASVRMRRGSWVGLTFWTATCWTAAWTLGALADPMSTLFAPGTFARQPQDLAWRPQTRELSYFWSEGPESDRGLWLDDARGDVPPRILLRPADLGAQDASAVSWQGWRSDGQAALFSVDHQLVLFDLETGQARALTHGGDPPADPKFSPDGRTLAYLRGPDLYLLDLASGVEQRLTEDGVPGLILNGATDWVYWEEIWGRTAAGFWFSPNSTHLAYYHFDDSAVAVYPLVDTRPLTPTVDAQRYPKAGGVLPRVEVRVVELASGRTVTLMTGEDPQAYLARVAWHPAGDKVAIQRLNRAQNQLDLLLCSAQDGSCSQLLRETWPTWVNLGDEFTFLPDGRFLWGSERSGWRHLYLMSALGQLMHQLTPAGWSLTSLDAVHPQAGRLVFTAHATSTLGAAERHVFQAHLDGTPAQRLTHEPGWHEALVAPSGDWVETRSSADTPPEQRFRQLTTLLDPAPRRLPQTPGTLDPQQLPAWEFLTVPGPDGVALPAQLLKPRDWTPTRRYPVVMYHYGGPGSQVVENRWRAPHRRYLWQKLMAERGYVILALDNSASIFFGKRGEDQLHRRFGELELAAQLAGVEFLRQQPWVDPQRIGLWGWSGGGSNTLYCLLRRPGVWRAGVAGAPVTDWHTYDAIWTERYLGHPQDNPAGYTASSPLTHAAELRDPLLIVHGTTDNNVHPQNTYNLIARWISASVRFELALYPNQRHSLQTFETAAQQDFFRRLTDFFDHYLAPAR